MDAQNLNDIVYMNLSQVGEPDAEIVFDFEGVRIAADMSDQGFVGPEAMTLYGPSNQIIVWN